MNFEKNKLKLLYLGQTPPPFYGAAISNQALVNATYTKIKLYHVRLHFSSSVTSIGVFQIAKIIHLISVIFKTLRMKYKYGIKNLFYPAAGPNLGPILRDIVLLGTLRIFFRRVIIEFSAAGLSEYIKKSNFILRYLALRVYGKADGVFQRSLLNPPDGEYFNAKKICIVGGGVPDVLTSNPPIEKNGSGPFSILYSGIIHESKGILILLQAARLIRERNLNFNISLMGEFRSQTFKEKVFGFIADNDLDKEIALLGLKKGNEKWDQYKKADVLCFPTFYEAESFGLVIIEAMMFKLPVVTTNWRAIPGIVIDGETGFLVPIKNSEALAEKIIELISDADLREEMGKAGRKRYVNEFTVEHFINKFEKSVVETLG